MKISEVEAVLAQYRRLYGDVEVMVADQDGDGPIHSIHMAYAESAVSIVPLAVNMPPLRETVRRLAREIFTRLAVPLKDRRVPGSPRIPNTRT